jgi:hypothetical protein
MVDLSYRSDKISTPKGGTPDEVYHYPVSKLKMTLYYKAVETVYQLIINSLIIC